MQLADGYVFTFTDILLSFEENQNAILSAIRVLMSSISILFWFNFVIFHLLCGCIKVSYRLVCSFFTPLSFGHLPVGENPKKQLQCKI